MKKLLFLTAILSSLLTGLVSCSDEEEIITDPPMGSLEFIGDISRDGDLFYLTVIECLDTHLTKIENWPGKTVWIQCANDSLSNLMTEVVDCELNPVRILVDQGSFMDAIDHPESSTWLHSILELNDSTTRSIDTDYFNPPPPAWFFEPMSRSAFQMDGHYEVINIFVHILRTTKGATPDLEDTKENIMNDIVDRLNWDFGINNTHFKFRAIGVDEIDYISSSFNINDDKLYAKATALNNRPDALNIYVIGSIASDAKAAGKAVVRSNACIIHPDYYKGPTVPHEVGHCLGLYHTHRGTASLWKQYNNNTESGTPEFVDGSNSANAGDYIVDTPADPCLWPWYAYSGNSSIVDGHGSRYNPLQYNIMSYNTNETRTDFTPMQAQRMHESIYKDASLAKIASNRYIILEGTPLGDAGYQHFTERTRTLTFPVVAPDEEVTWTIYQRSGGYGETSHATPSVTTKKGHSITIEHNSPADCYEVYATTTTPFGAERKAEWKASAGVPSPAVGTLNWTAGGGSTMGSVPGYSPTLIVPHDINISFNYTDFANPAYRRGITYRVYTANGGVYETGMDVVLSDMECANGYIDVQPVDPCCGASYSMFRIYCQLKWDFYSLDVKNGQLSIGVKAATATDEAVKASAKSDLAISSLKIITPEGREMIGRKLDTPQRAMSLSTSSLPKGQYDIEITDLDGKIHKGRFGID